MLLSITAPFLDGQGGGLTPPALISTVLALAGVMACCYRYGVQREQAHSIANRLSLDFERLRDDMRTGLAAIERRVRAFENALTVIFDQHVAERRRGERVDASLADHEQRITALEHQD